MCKVSDIVLEVKTLTDGEIYSIRTLQEIRDTFPKKDVIGIENTDGYYANSTGKYKICSSDSELLTFCDCARHAIFACSSTEAMQYLYIKDQMVDTKKTKIYALNSKMEICAYPYTNVHDDCRICWGSLKIPKVNGLAESTKILDFFLAAENNNDLLNTYTKDCLSASCTHALLTKLKNKKEFKDEWLKPLGVTFGDII